MSRHASSRALAQGMLVTPNAMHALNHLGVGRQSRGSVERLRRKRSLSTIRLGAILQRRPGSGNYKSRYGAGHFRVHRADLHNALSAAVLQNDPSCIHLDHTFSEMSQDENAVVTQFVNGAAATGDALIGCDGGRSRGRVHALWLKARLLHRPSRLSRAYPHCKITRYAQVAIAMSLHRPAPHASALSVAQKFAA